MWFDDDTKPCNLNLVGIRHKDHRVTNKFDDVYTISWKHQGLWRFRSFAATVDPGTYYSTVKLLNPRGVAILARGQYRGAYQLDLHRGEYQALVQRKPVSVHRDGNKDNILDIDPDNIDVGLFGINHHRAHFAGVTQWVNTHSAGCQVLANADDFKELIRLCNKARLSFGNAFTYTLLHEEVDL